MYEYFQQIHIHTYTHTHIYSYTNNSDWIISSWSRIIYNYGAHTWVIIPNISNYNIWPLTNMFRICHCWIRRIGDVLFEVLIKIVYTRTNISMSTYLAPHTVLHNWFSLSPFLSLFLNFSSLHLHILNWDETIQFMSMSIGHCVKFETFLNLIGPPDWYTSVRLIF